jgi:hypothetical protein
MEIITLANKLIEAAEAQTIAIDELTDALNNYVEFLEDEAERLKDATN